MTHMLINHYASMTHLHFWL